jgi:hypothetical protein
VSGFLSRRFTPDNIVSLFQSSFWEINKIESYFTVNNSSWELKVLQTKKRSGILFYGERNKKSATSESNTFVLEKISIK